MDLETLRAYCLRKGIGVTEDLPFGEDVLVFRVGRKIFLLARLRSVPPQVNLKCDPALALELRERYDAVRPGYHMSKKHWNTVVLDGSVSDVEVQRMVDHSFDLVASGLPALRAPGAKHRPSSKGTRRPKTGRNRRQVDR